MLNFILGKIQRFSSNNQREELQYFLDIVRSLNPEEKAILIALAAHTKNTYLSISNVLSMSNGEKALYLSRGYNKLQSENNLFMAGGLAIWLHVIRSISYPANKFLVSEMLSLLEPHIDLVEKTSMIIGFTKGIVLKIDNYDSIFKEMKNL
jgi:hypothetical protein